MKYAIWYLNNKDEVKKTHYGCNNYIQAVKSVNFIRSMKEDGKRVYKKVWIAHEDSPGPLGYFHGDPEPQYSYKKFTECVIYEE